MDAGALLTLAESTLQRRRALDVEDLQTCAHWGTLHGEPPVHESHGGPRLVQVGGVGTTPVQDLSLAELALTLRATAPGRSGIRYPDIINNPAA